jgi:hypothetical protein
LIIFAFTTFKPKEEVRLGAVTERNEGEGVAVGDVDEIVTRERGGGRDDSGGPSTISVENDTTSSRSKLSSSGKYA